MKSYASTLSATSIKCKQSCNKDTECLIMIEINEEEKSTCVDLVDIAQNINSEAIKPKNYYVLKSHIHLSLRCKVE